MRMNRARRPLGSAVVVVTGASSGIGRATALELARRRSTVVVAARRELPLNDVVAACERVGGRALAVPTDMTDEPAVEALARRAVEQFGRLDVWVNNAGVYAAGRFDDVPSAVFRRVIDTNLLGYAAGARVALWHFRRQGNGVLINVGSIGSRVPMAYFSAYTAAKFGALGLTLVLRQELRGTDVHACAVLPASIDTPIFQHAANYTGRALQAMSPVSGAEQVARAIVAQVEYPRRMVVVGASAGFLTRLHIVAPSLAEWLVARMIELRHTQKTAASPPTGNLFSPAGEGTEASGGWKYGPWPVARSTPKHGAVAWRH